MKQGYYPMTIRLAFVLLYSGTLVFHIRSLGELSANPLDHATMFRFACVALSATLAFGFASLNRLPLGLLFRTSAARWCTVYAIIGAIGSLISPYPLMSLYKASELFMVCVVTVICTEGGFRIGRQFAPLITMYALLTCLACSVLFGGFIFPQRAWHWYPTGWHWQIEGVLPLFPANSVGELGAILLIVTIGFWLKTRRFLWLPLMLLSFILFLAGYSRTSLLALPLSLLFLVRLRYRRAVVPVFIVSVLAATSYFLFSDWIVAALLRGQTVHEFSLLTGRIHWWTVAFDQFLKSPFLGSGFGNVGARYFVFEKMGLDTMGGVHSAYVQALLESGLIGAVPFFAMLFCGVRFCVASARMPKLSLWRAVNAGVVSILLIRTLTSSALAGYGPSLILFLLILLAHQRRENIVQSSIVMPSRSQTSVPLE